MKIAVIGAGNIGRTLAASWAGAGHSVTFGARDPAQPVAVADTRVASIPDALEDARVVLLAVPAGAVAGLADEHRAALAGKPVIDTTVRFSVPRPGEAPMLDRGPLNSLDVLADVAGGYIRSFCTLGWELFADPVVDGAPTDQFFTASDDDARSLAERLIGEVGLRPVYLGGDDTVEVMDGLTRLWFTLAFTRGLGRRISVRLLRQA